MSDPVNPRHLIEEMRHDVAAGDFRKAALVLTHLNSVEDEAKLAILSELAQGESRMALPLLASVLAENPMLEFTLPQVREWLGEVAASSPEEFIRSLQEARGAVRVVLVSIASGIGMEEAQEVLTSILNQEQNPTVISAVLEALGEVGGDESVVSVAEYLYASDDEMFSSAARSLARIGTPAAVEQLRRRIGHQSHLDEVLVGILWEVQSPEALAAVMAMLASPHAVVRGTAKQALRMTGVKASPLLAENLQSASDDVLVHTLELLGEIGDPSAYRDIRHLLSRHPSDPNVRFAAYEALGKLPMQGRGFALAAGLEDSVESVRAAAAAAIERNLDAPLLAGVKNLLDSQEGMRGWLARAGVEARAIRLTGGLADADEGFRSALVEYLALRAHPEVRAFFAAEYAKAGFGAIAAVATPPVEEEALPRRRVFAVDDSLLVLRIYKAALHQLGFEPVTFASPVEAAEAVRNEKPAAVFTDLNMPEITGVELIARMRRVFSKEELPIAMVTTQREGEDFAAADAAGVTRVLHKPFTAADLSAALTAMGVGA